MAEDNSNCIFCKMARGEMKVLFAAETANFFAILDIHPKAEGHTLIIPKKHFATLLDLPDNLGGELLGLTKKISKKLLDDDKGEGFNVVMNNLEAAGQIVRHAHIHIIPRKKGDGLRSIV